MTHDCHINNNIEQFVRGRLIELIKKINTAERVQVSPTEPSAALVVSYDIPSKFLALLSNTFRELIDSPPSVHKFYEGELNIYIYIPCKPNPSATFPYNNFVKQRYLESYYLSIRTPNYMYLDTYNMVLKLSDYFADVRNSKINSLIN